MTSADSPSRKIEAGLAVENLSVEVRSQNGWRPLVQGVSFAAAAGSILGLVGESGWGKSITAAAILGLLPRGAHIASGRHGWARRSSRRSMTKRCAHPATHRHGVPGPELGAVPARHRPAAEDIVRAHSPGPAGGAGPRHRMLERSACRMRRGGCRTTRTSFPAACAARGDRDGAGGRAELVIADEPTTALDVTIQAQILDLLRRTQRGMRMAHRAGHARPRAWSPARATAWR